MGRVVIAAVLAAAAGLCCGCADTGVGGALMIARLGGKNGCGADGTAGSCKTVELGGKTWMAENLNYKTSGSRCYNNRESDCDRYGRLYTWSAAVSACQSVGWRLPDTADWRRLVESAGDLSVAGKALKTTFGWRDNGNGTDSYGFSALPAGYRLTDGSFSGAGDGGSWWTATEYGGGFAYHRDMGYGHDYVLELNDVVGFGFSARCVKD